MKPHPFFCLVLLVFATVRPPCAGAQGASDPLRINQVGYYPEAPKVAVVVGAPAGPFHVTTAGGETVFSGTLSAASTWSASGESVRRADFSALRVPGTYVLSVPGVGTSAPFVIQPDVHRSVALAAIKGYY